MFRDNLLSPKTHPDHRRRHRPWQSHGPPLSPVRRNSLHLRPPRRRSRENRSRTFPAKRPNPQHSPAMSAISTPSRSMIDAIWKSGPLDVLVNNAAGNFIARTEELSPRAFESVIGIVLFGTLHATMACGRRWLKSSHSGTVLSISATYAPVGSAYVVPSAVSKAGVEALTRSLAVEWGNRGIRMNAIAPGPIPTQGAFSRLMPRPELEIVSAGSQPHAPLRHQRRIGKPGRIPG